MTRSFLILLPVVVFFSCKKDLQPLPTIVKGTVVDSKTGTPVSHAIIAIANHIPNEIGIYENLTEYVTSDDEGHFSYTVRSAAKTASLYSVSAESYATKSIDYQQFGIEMEITNEFTIPLIRLDAVLKIHLKNINEQDENVFLVISNPTKLEEARSDWGVYKFFPLSIILGEEKSYLFPVKSSEYTTIYWGGSHFFPYETSPFRDSLYFNIGDTLDYTIHF